MRDIRCASAAAGQRYPVKTNEIPFGQLRVPTAGYLEISLKPLRIMLPKRIEGLYGQH
jgi:hypothetical protein